MGSGASIEAQQNIHKLSHEDLTMAFECLNLESKRKIEYAMEALRKDHDDESVSTAAESSKGTEMSEGPRTVYGFEGLFAAAGNDLEAIGNLVAEILQDCGWSDVDRMGIFVEDKSGEGGSKTFKVSAPSALPPQVAVHARSSGIVGDPVSEERAAYAAFILGQADVTPARIAQGEDWYVEPWEGKAHVEFGEITVNMAHNLGSLMARIHKTPTEWYDAFRQRLCALRPKLAGADLGSSFWKESCRLKHLSYMDESDEDTWLRWFANAPMPTHCVTSKVVTCHGDFHRGNIICTDSGTLKAIDLEFTCVMYAAEDLNYAFHSCCKTLDIKRAFVEGYLSTLGEFVDTETIEAVIFDIECYAALSSHYWETIRQHPNDESDSIASLEKYRAICEAAATNPELRQDVLEKGFMRCAPAMKLRAEEKRRKYFALEPMLSIASTEHECATVVELATLSSPAVPEDKRSRWPLNLLASQLTCACWVVLEPCDETSPLFFQVMMLCAAEAGKGLGDFCIHWSEGTLTFSLDGNEVGKGSDAQFKLPHLADGAWHHLTFVYDADDSQLRLFMDCSLVETRTFSLAFPIRLTTISVGEQRNDGDRASLAEWTRFPEGRLRNFSMHTRILSLEEIRDSYSAACDHRNKPCFEIPVSAPIIGNLVSEERKEEMLCLLVSMGISVDKATRALDTTGWSSVDSALEVAMTLNESCAPPLGYEADMLEEVKALGFDDSQAKAALDATGWAGVDLAVANLFGD